jgi:hypothetical protein
MIAAIYARKSTGARLVVVMPKEPRERLGGAA